MQRASVHHIINLFDRSSLSFLFVCLFVLSRYADVPRTGGHVVVVDGERTPGSYFPRSAAFSDRDRDERGDRGRSRGRRDADGGRSGARRRRDRAQRRDEHVQRRRVQTLGRGQDQPPRVGLVNEPAAEDLGTHGAPQMPFLANLDGNLHVGQAPPRRRRPENFGLVSSAPSDLVPRPPASDPTAGDPSESTSEYDGDGDGDCEGEEAWNSARRWSDLVGKRTSTGFGREAPTTPAAPERNSATEVPAAGAMDGGTTWTRKAPLPDIDGDDATPEADVWQGLEEGRFWVKGAKVIDAEDRVHASRPLADIGSGAVSGASLFRATYGRSPTVPLPAKPSPRVIPSATASPRQLALAPYPRVFGGGGGSSSSSSSDGSSSYGGEANGSIEAESLHLSRERSSSYAGSSEVSVDWFPESDSDGHNVGRQRGVGRGGGRSVAVGSFGEVDEVLDDAAALTFLTQALPSEAEVSGHPEARAATVRDRVRRNRTWRNGSALSGLWAGSSAASLVDARERAAEAAIAGSPRPSRRRQQRRQSRRAGAVGSAGGGPVPARRPGVGGGGSGLADADDRSVRFADRVMVLGSKAGDATKGAGRG